MHARLIRTLAIPAAVIGTLALAGAAAAPGAAGQPRTTSPPLTAYVTNTGSNTVTAINTVTNKAYSTIKVGASPSKILIAPNGKTAYIAGSTGVTPVSTVTHKAGQLIAIKYGVTGMAITPNGKTLYVVTLNEKTFYSTVIPVSTATGKVGHPLSWQSKPGGNVQLTVTPNGKTLYIGSTPGTVTPVSTATGKVGKPIKFASGMAYGTVNMAITPNGRTLYAFMNGANQVWNTVTPINTATNTAGKPIKVGQFPVALVFSAYGKTAYVASTGAYEAACINRSPRCEEPQLSGPVPATVTPISTATNKPGKAITLGPTAYAITMAITPNRITVYVGDSWIVGNRSAYAVIPINAVTGKAGKTVKVSWGPNAMAISANGKTVYCVGENSSGQGLVMPISTANGTLLTAIQVGKSPTAIAIAP
jgi:YVTN family beta-propeller protein